VPSGPEKNAPSVRPTLGTTTMSMAEMSGAWLQKESLPGLRPPSPSLGHVLGDGRLHELEAELEQLAVDARRSPKQVLHRGSRVHSVIFTNPS
jgi:hypothetical protein